jgi:type I restriction enzyme, S subunit
MPTYQRLPLGDVCQLTAGPSGALLANLADGHEGVPVIAPPDITDAHAIETRRLRRVPEAEVVKLSRFALQHDDVLFVRQGTLGRFAVLAAEQEGWFYSSSCMRLRPRPEYLLPSYLAACLAHEPIRRALIGKALPGTVPSLNTATLSDFPIPVPPLAEQRELAAAIADIERSARAHRAIVDRLESLKQAVFSESVATVGEGAWGS